MGIKRIFPGAALFAVSLAAQVTDDQVVTRRFATGSAAPEVVVRIVNGGIRVTAHSGNEVELTAKVHYEAPDVGSLARLKQDIRLETEQSGSNVWIGVEGESYGTVGGKSQRELGWRGKQSSQTRGEGRRLRFSHEIELKVPSGAHLKLSTVNHGDIQVDSVQGEFYMNNVNGGIRLSGLASPGRAHTVNGPVNLSFARNPSGPLSVRTVNGKVELNLNKGLNADFRMKTLNGKIFTDFLMTARAAETAVSSEQGMKRIWRTGGSTGGRVGSGGPEISIETVNGEIRIAEKGN